MTSTLGVRSYLSANVVVLSQPQWTVLANTPVQWSRVRLLARPWMIKSLFTEYLLTLQREVSRYPHLTSCFCFDSTALLVLVLIEKQIHLFGQIQTSQTGGQQYIDTSHAVAQTPHHRRRKYQCTAALQSELFWFSGLTHFLVWSNTIQSKRYQFPLRRKWVFSGLFHFCGLIEETTRLPLSAETIGITSDLSSHDHLDRQQTRNCLRWTVVVTQLVEWSIPTP